MTDRVKLTKRRPTVAEHDHVLMPKGLRLPRPTDCDSAAPGTRATPVPLSP